MITHLKLPFSFDIIKLKSDLSKILKTKWQAHYNSAGYEGTWKVISLFSTDGKDTNIFANSSNSEPLLATEILKSCDYLKELIKQFKCPILSARILKLDAGSKIKPHRDHALGYEDGCFRIHIPIITNPHVIFMLNGQRIILSEGECWYTNVNYIHSVSNEGTEDRIHLVIDGQRNKWSDNIFFSLANKEELLTAIQNEESEEELILTLEALKTRDEPAVEQLIKDLEIKLTKLRSNKL